MPGWVGLLQGRRRLPAVTAGSPSHDAPEVGRLVSVDWSLWVAAAARSARAELLDRVVLTLRGELDCETASVLEATLRDVIERQGNLDVIIDLGDLDFIDSRSLAALDHGRPYGQGLGGDLILSNPSPQARKVLEVTGVIDLFTVTRA